LVHTARTQGHCPGLPSQEASGQDRSAPSGVGQIRFGIAFLEGRQRFIAGWSSPVARQAHNLKVIGSNPIPATKIDPVDQALTPRLPGFFVWQWPAYLYLGRVLINRVLGSGTPLVGP
jgi:hypothetical protein